MDIRNFPAAFQPTVRPSFQRNKNAGAIPNIKIIDQSKRHHIEEQKKIILCIRRSHQVLQSEENHSEKVSQNRQFRKSFRSPKSVKVFLKVLALERLSRSGTLAVSSKNSESSFWFQVSPFVLRGSISGV